VPPRLAPVGKQVPPTRAAPSLVRALRDARGALYSLPGQACPNAREGSRLNADEGSNFNAD
jgi:hypothetical protein